MGRMRSDQIRDVYRLWVLGRLGPTPMTRRKPRSVRTLLDAVALDDREYVAWIRGLAEQAAKIPAWPKKKRARRSRG